MAELELVRDRRGPQPSASVRGTIVQITAVLRRERLTRRASAPVVEIVVLQRLDRRPGTRRRPRMQHEPRPACASFASAAWHVLAASAGGSAPRPPPDARELDHAESGSCWGRRCSRERLLPTLAGGTHEGDRDSRDTIVIFRTRFSPAKRSMSALRGDTRRRALDELCECALVGSGFALSSSPSSRP